MSESEPKSPLNIINPLYLGNSEMLEFMHRYKDASQNPDGGDRTYVGSEDLKNLIRDEKVGVGAIVRISPGGSVHTFHILTPFGLVNYLHSEHPIKTHEEVLDQTEMGHPIRWTLDGFDFLADDTLESLKQGQSENPQLSLK